MKLPLGGLIPSDALVILGHSLECITLKNMQESRTLLGVSEHGLYLPILAISWKMNTWSNGFRAPYFQPQMLQNGPYHPYSYGSLHVYIYIYVLYIYIYELLCIYIYMIYIYIYIWYIYIYMSLSHPIDGMITTSKILMEKPSRNHRF